jgi:hypothetical protein
MKHSKPNNRLFHYCKLNTAIEKILPKKELLLSPLLNTNDPRENKSFVFAGVFSNETNFDEMERLNNEISLFLRNDTKVISFSNDDSIHHFSGFEYSRMWAYYGDNHKGLCIELDKDKFLSENKNIIDSNLLRKISYYEFDIKKPVEHKWVNHHFMEHMGKEKYLRKNFRNENLEYLYFTKDKEWESENEVRLVYFSENQENEYCTIQNCISNIFVGVDFNNAYLPSIIKTCPEIAISKLHYQSVRLIPKEIYTPKN